jgi:hypothetical protein
MTPRLRRTYELFQDAAFESLEGRLARQVLYLAEREGRPTPQGLRLAHRFRQADLADLLGATTRSRHRFGHLRPRPGDANGARQRRIPGNCRVQGLNLAAIKRRQLIRYCEKSHIPGERDMVILHP